MSLPSPALRTSATSTVVVSGASSGIGLAIAADLVTEGMLVFGTVRTEEDAARVRQQLGAQFVPLLVDVCDEASIRAAVQLVASKLDGRTLTGLVNNAGICCPGPTLELSVADWQQQLDVNVLGPVRMIQAFAPLLGVDATRQGKKGRIVNISSVSGKLAFPFLGAYAASKHALEALSESLRRELRIFGINVTVIGPGNVRTPIWKKSEVFAEKKETHLYREQLERLRARARHDADTGARPEEVALAVRRALLARRPPFRVAVVRSIWANWLLPRWLPARLLDYAVGKELGLPWAR